MKKKFINTVIYGHEDCDQILVEDGKFVGFGKDLGEVDQVIDLEGFHLMLIATFTLTITW